jgi:hypothetical protein
MASMVTFANVAVAKDVHFSAQVDRNQITKDDTVTLTLELSSDGNIDADQEPRLPQLDGWQLLDKWTQSESSSVYDGTFKFIRKFDYHYTLTPKKLGNLEIGAASIRVNGKSYETAPIKILVASGGSQLPHQPQAKPKASDQDENQGANPFGGADDDDDDLYTQLLRRQKGLGGNRGGGNQGGNTAPNVTVPDANESDIFFVGVEVNKKKVYVGEEVIATWYLYTRGGLENLDTLKYPTLKGFWKEDLEMATRLNYQQVLVNGIPYNRALLVSYAIFPIGLGNKVIDAYQAKATVMKMDNPMAMFGLGSRVQMTKSSKEMPIEVMPLPTEGKPASFSGAVGHFNVTGSLSSTTVKANQPVSLKIRFSGAGNAKAIDLPPINLPKTLELYDTKSDTKFQKNGEGYKEFELLIIPRAEGDVTIPPISVSSFDPKTGKYVSSETPSFSLKVLPGDASNPNNVAPGPQQSAAPTDLKGQGPDIKYLKTSSILALPADEERLLWFIAFLTVYLSFSFQIWRTLTGRIGDSVSETKKRVKKKLLAARLKLKNKDFRGVGVECQNAILQTLSEVSKGSTSQTVTELLHRLPKETQALQVDIDKFLSRCEVISFAPEEMASQMSAEVERLITGAEKIIGQLLAVNESRT